MFYCSRFRMKTKEEISQSKGEPQIYPIHCQMIMAETLPNSGVSLDESVGLSLAGRCERYESSGKAFHR